jgi:hypothetical protein
MSRYDDDDDDFDSTDEGSINSIRKALRAEQKARKALESELTELRGRDRQRTLETVIKDKGLNPLVAGLIPADVTNESLDSWLTTYGSLFAAPGEVAPEESGESDPPPPDGAQTFGQVVSTGSAPQSDDGQLLAQIQGARTKEELDRLIFGKSLG